MVGAAAVPQDHAFVEVVARAAELVDDRVGLAGVDEAHGADRVAQAHHRDVAGAEGALAVVDDDRPVGACGLWPWEPQAAAAPGARRGRSRRTAADQGMKTE